MSMGRTLVFLTVFIVIVMLYLQYIFTMDVGNPPVNIKKTFHEYTGSEVKDHEICPVLEDKVREAWIFDFKCNLAYPFLSNLLESLPREKIIKMIAKEVYERDDAQGICSTLTKIRYRSIVEDARNTGC